MDSVAQGSPSAKSIEDLLKQLESLRLSITQQAGLDDESLSGLTPDRLRSAENLLRYVALRSRDIRPLQGRLARLGLSSLGHAEAHVLESIDAVLHNLHVLRGRHSSETDAGNVCAIPEALTNQLESNTVALLGKEPLNRRARIIVTLSSEAVDDYMLVHQLLDSGMNCMRINCVHDGPSTWSRMIEQLRNAEQATGRSCRVLMDLGGPKLRLGPMEAIPAVLKVKPVREKDGSIVRPARIWLGAAGESYSAMPTADASLALEPAWQKQLKTGDRVKFRDHRGSNRTWRIGAVDSSGCWAEARKTAYIANGIVFSLRRNKEDTGQQTTLESLVPVESVSIIRKGDILFMSVSDRPGKAAVHDSHGDLVKPGRVSLPVAEVFRDVRPGEPVFFDDGRISGLVEKRKPAQLQIRITHTHNPVEKLEGRRGINLPDSNLKLPALGEKDRQDLEFAVLHSDLVGLSFTNTPDDVHALRKSLKELGREDIGVVLKIETRQGVSRLPQILLEALKLPVCGVMIARGDLAVECGFERMCEIQEDILSVCEAAHIPVIWATQVLEGLTKKGHVTRAEITDAAKSQAAEAVMLNKGPHINEAVIMLDDILQRMQGHHFKKRSIMRELHLVSV